jgi:phosphinothricin acetyltransferase
MREMATFGEVRPAGAADMGAVCDIVNHYIMTTRINFRTHAQSPDEWRRDWERLREQYPWLVATIDGGIVGVAYAGPWNPRNAYAWSAEVTLYVDHRAQRRGIGSALYSRLLPALDGQGYRFLVGVIALPNPASVAIHEAFGFQHAGTLHAVGYKMGQWCDVGLWQRVQGDINAAPQPLQPVANS